MPKTANLHLKAENLPETDFFGKIDPYYEVYYHKTKLFTSPCHKNAERIVDWGVQTFQVPTRAVFRELNVKIYDKDTFSADDLLLNIEVRYPFRCNSYTLGNSGAVLKVLDDDGNSDSELTEGSLDSDDPDYSNAAIQNDEAAKEKKKNARSKQKSGKKESGYFKIVDLGVFKDKVEEIKDKVADKVEDAAVKVGIKEKKPTFWEKIGLGPLCKSCKKGD